MGTKEYLIHLRAKLGGLLFFPRVETDNQSRGAVFHCKAKVDIEKVEGMSLHPWQYLLEMHNVFTDLL